MPGNRVAVFIDHSNVVHRLSDMRKVDSGWAKWYSPQALAEKLTGNRVLTKTYFYCCPPPNEWLHQGEYNKCKYWRQISYYQEVRKCRQIQIAYATLTGSGASLAEKNLDTQMSNDILMKAVANEYDIAIVVSSDGDFVSAVEYLHQFGKKVETLNFSGRSSMALRSICDVSRRARKSHFVELSFEKSDLKSKTGGL